MTPQPLQSVEASIVTTPPPAPHQHTTPSNTLLSLSLRPLNLSQNLHSNETLLDLVTDGLLTFTTAFELRSAIPFF
jgi:hypothetical protein